MGEWDILYTIARRGRLGPSCSHLAKIISGGCLDFVHFVVAVLFALMSGQNGAFLVKLPTLTPAFWREREAEARFSIYGRGLVLRRSDWDFEVFHPPPQETNTWSTCKLLRGRFEISPRWRSFFQPSQGRSRFQSSGVDLVTHFFLGLTR